MKLKRVLLAVLGVMVLAGAVAVPVALGDGGPIEPECPPKTHCGR